MRLFLDANILFSAAHTPAGRAHAFFLLAHQGRCELLSSPHAIEEARRNIQLKYPKESGRLNELVSGLSVTAEATSEGVAWAMEQSLPLEDAPILAAALEAGANFLVTGDRTHFGHLYGKCLKGLRVTKPKEVLLKIIRQAKDTSERMP